MDKPAPRSASDPEGPLDVRPDDVRRVLELVRRTHGVDLSDYRATTLARRIAWFLASRQAGGPGGRAGIECRLEHLDRDPVARERLLGALLVPVTEFFRDAPVFDALRRCVLPALVAGERPRPVRAWVVGAATGEEAWSLAMLLAVACEDRAAADFRVLATDVDPALVQAGQCGCYDREAARAVPPDLAERFLRPAGSMMEVDPVLRERVIFARHDIVGRELAPAEAVVPSFALILMRNLLIYFTPRLQERALARIAASADPGAALVLGTAENLGPAAALDFEAYPGVPPELRIFRRRADVR